MAIRVDSFRHNLARQKSPFNSMGAQVRAPSDSYLQRPWVATEVLVMVLNEQLCLKSDHGIFFDSDLMWFCSHETGQRLPLPQEQFACRSTALWVFPGIPAHGQTELKNNPNRT